MVELTMNVKLSPIALKCRALRLQSGKDIKAISQKCGISVDDLLSFETDKKKPTKRQIRVLESFCLNN